MGTEIPKQFLEIQGMPVLMHSMNRFIDFDADIILIIALPAQQIENWKSLCVHHNYLVPHHIVEGGSERFYSVKNALALVEENSLVGIHDAVRPMVSKQTIKLAYESALQFGSGIPSIALNDSIRVMNGNSSKAVNRSAYQIIQTPQCFASTILLQAFKQVYKPEFTDDATVLESFGMTVHLTQGNPENIKLTTPADLKIAEVLINGIA